MARPKKYTEELILKIVKKIEAYTDAEDIPVLKEFCYKNHILKQTLYEHEGFSDSIKRLIDKKEAQLEIKALNGDIIPSVAIFSLKQLGWKDRQEISGITEHVVYTDLSGVSKDAKKELRQALYGDRLRADTSKG